MPKVVGVSFKKNSKKYYFLCNEIDDLIKDSEVIVETEKGKQYGFVVENPKVVSDDDIGLELKKVLRIASDKDKENYLRNQKDAKQALIEARKIASNLKLKMNLIDSSFTFDRNQLLFNFLADNRVDFRDLAKKLAQLYKTRIELRQIGVRDKAKEIGGLGPCGRFLCCSSFLTDFNSVSINMAKNQMLALNPTKINGVCGRLLCCLNYEDDTYTEMKSRMPKMGEIYRKDDIEGKVVGLNLLKGIVTIEMKNRNQIEVEDESWKL